VGVLVTGANGFIGSNLVRKLLDEGNKVRCLVHKSDHRLKNLPVEIVWGSMLDDSVIKNATDGVDLVYHLAGRATDWGSRGTFFRSNVDGTRKVARFCVENGVKRLVFSSSLAVHRFSGHVDSDEETPADQRKYAYGASKVGAEKIVDYIGRSTSLETVIVRPGVVVWGPEDTTAFVHMAPLLEHGRWGHVSGGRTLLCYSYIDNLVSGLILAGFSEKARGNTFIITDDIKLTWKDLIAATISAFGARERTFSFPGIIARPVGVGMEMLWRFFGAKNPPPVTDYRTALVSKDFHFSCKKAKKLLGYEPMVDFEQGLTATIDWWRKNRADGK